MLALALASRVMAADSAVASLPQHLGVASCAASICHGKIKPQANADVALNEYRIWLLSDRHSQAFRILQSPKSRAIANKLGFDDATRVRQCLDCHADNVPVEQRGDKFVLSDGVGCEVCHGAAQSWIASHSKAGTAHADNVAHGLVPLDRAAVRADVCLSCHAGNGERFVTHTLIAAGHPRLRFELETFLANMPVHYKGSIGGVNLWLLGQLQNARNQLQLLRADWLAGSGLQPELAFFECYACHRPVDEPRWTQQRAGAGVLPGALRLQHQSLAVLQIIAGLIEPQSLPELQQAIADYRQTGSQNLTAVARVATRLTAWLDARSAWTTRRYDNADAQQLRLLLIAFAASDQGSDYTVAEQLVLSLESLSHTLGDVAARRVALDALYATVRTPAAFDPAAFARVARSVRGQF